MNYFGFTLLFISSVLLRGFQLQFVQHNEHLQEKKLIASLQDDLDLIQLSSDHLEAVSLIKSLPDDLDLSHVNWQLMIPYLMQRQQLRLCMSIYRHDQHLIAHTPCEQLLRSEPMADCDIGHAEDLSMAMCKEFSSILFDTQQQCRPGLEIFGMRCRRRA